MNANRRLMVITATLQTSGSAIQCWRASQVTIEQACCETRRWMRQGQQNGDSRFDELASRLWAIRESFEAHFQCGIDLYDTLRRELWCVEVESAQRQAVSDHSYLIARIDSLLSNLETTTRSMSMFDDVVEQIELFFDEFELHEEREADGFTWLLQHQCA